MDANFALNGPVFRENQHADHIDTPRVIVRPSDNQMVWRWDNADPFGNTSPNNNPAGLGQFVYNPRFPGQLYDIDTGTYYNINRNYDPALGRYVQSDPIGLKGGANSYTYVAGNPLTRADRNGLWTCQFYGIVTICHDDPIYGPDGPMGGSGSWGSNPTSSGSSSSTSSSTSADEKEKCPKCLPATPENIKKVVMLSVYRTLQPSVSAAVVQSYVEDIESGLPIPPINVDMDIIVDGNHRFIAALLCHQVAPEQPWTAPISKEAIPIYNIEVTP